MNPTIFFSVCSLFYCILLLYILSFETKKNNVESKILKFLTTINLGSLICEGAGIFLGNNYEKFRILNDISLRLMLVLYVAWFSMFVLYVLNIAKNYNKSNIKKTYPLFIIMLIAVVLVSFLPITYNTNSDGVIIYTTGLAVELVYYYAMACETVCLFIMFKNSKKVRVSNYASLFALIILSTLAAAIQSIYPSLLLTASSETFVLFLVYLNYKKADLLCSKNKGE